MSLRPLRLSTDFRVGAEIIPRAFQYPENEAWSVQSDKKEDLIDTFDSLARIWPLLWLMLAAFPALRDLARGYVWEEMGQPVGLLHFRRQERTNIWTITTVAVLPNYRRRGIGRKMVQASLDFIRERGGKVTLLDVIAGNVPAYSLYEQLGFECFCGSIAIDYKQSESPSKFPLPNSYTVSPLSASDWRGKYDLVLRITPAEVQRYEPVQEAHFQSTLSGRLLASIMRKAGGERKEEIIVRAASKEQIVAVGSTSARVRPGGVNRIEMRVDPAHPQVAPYLLHHLIRTTLRLSPERRIEFVIPQWQEAVIEAARDAGCVQRLEYHRMGLVL